MKKIMTIVASLAIVAGFASCQKDINIENGENNKSASITATFAEQTKVTYAESGTDLQPAWVVGDIIVGISESTAFELQVSSVTSGVATLNIKTGTLPEGDVTLFYKSGLTANDWDSNNKQFVVNFNLQNGNETMPAIMMAEGTINQGSGEFTFFNQGAVVGIYEVGDALKSKTIKQVTLYGNGLASSANLSSAGVTLNYPNNGYNVISTEILSGVNVGSDEKGTLNKSILMAVPAGAEVTKVFIRTTDGQVYSLAPNNSNKTISAGQYRYIKGVSFTRDVDKDDMILTGVYSVASDKQVFFSKGNLWYGKVGEAETPTFNIEANQYASTPTTDGNRSEDHISHFYWNKNSGVVTAQYYAGSSGPNDVFFTNASDFTVNVGGTEQSGWRTLFIDEWQYLLNTRTMTNEKARYTLSITYGGNKGMVIYPDNYDKATYSSGDTVTELQDGVVFLPYAGSRNGSLPGKQPLIVSSVGTGASYWTASPDGSNAYAISITTNGSYTSGPNFSKGASRLASNSIRLVSDCK